MTTSSPVLDSDWTSHLVLDTRFGPFLGDTRIRLLEAIAAHGSISQAAKVVPMAYKSAWDAVDIMNNLGSEPLVITATGGKKGGGTTLTPYGHTIVALYRAVEREYQESIRRLATAIPALDSPDEGRMRLLLRSMNCHYSARNQFLGKVIGLRADEIDYEVTLRLDSGEELVAVITGESAERMAVAIGKPMLALVKSSALVLTNDRQLRSSAKNRWWGEITRIHQGNVHAEVVIALASGKTLTAVVTQESANQLRLETGMSCGALCHANSVILASYD